MSLASVGKFVDAPGDDYRSQIVGKANARAGHFESDFQNLFGFGIQIELA